MQTAREITRTSQNQREVVFDLPHHPTLGTGPLQTIPHPGSERLDLFQGLPGGMVTGQIEPCITILFTLHIHGPNSTDSEFKILSHYLCSRVQPIQFIVTSSDSTFFLTHTLAKTFLIRCSLIRFDLTVS